MDKHKVITAPAELFHHRNQLSHSRNGQKACDLKYGKPRASGNKLRLEKQSGIKSFQASLATAENVNFIRNVTDINVGSAIVTNMPCWWRTSVNGGSYACVGAGVESLYLLLNFEVNLKLL